MNAKTAKCVALAAFVVVACAVLVFDNAASAHTAFYGAHFAFAVGLDQMRAQHRDLIRRAAAMIGDVRNGMSESQVRAIEDEHRQTLRNAEELGDAIAREERSDASSGKSWASRFYAMMAGQPISREELNQMVASAGTYDQAAERAIDWMAQTHNGNKPKPGPHGRHNAESLDNPQVFMKIGSEAVAAMIGGQAPGHPAAKELASANSLRPVLCQILQKNGARFNPHMSIGGLFQHIEMSGANSQSDFKNILGGAINLRLAAAYQVAPSPVVDVLAVPKDTPDLRPVQVAALGEMPLLLPVPEGAKIKYGSTVDNKESYAMVTYARAFGVTRQVLINDNLGALNRIADNMGRAAKQTLANAAVTVLIANSGDGVNLSDGEPLYATARGNKAGSGAGPDVTTVSAGRQAMRTMKGLAGEELVAATPKYLLVGAAKETDAERILHQLSAVTVAEVNPFGGALTLLVEPRITGNSWRLFADPGVLPVLEISYLNGARAPFVQARQGWDMLGTEWQVVMDAGVGAIDWRGTYLNPGA